MRIRTLVFAALVGVATIATPVAVSAQTDGNYVRQPPQVEGDDQARGDRPTNVGGVQVTRGQEALPFTGGDVIGLTAIGLASVGVGAVLVRRARRQPATA